MRPTPTPADGTTWTRRGLLSGAGAATLLGLSACSSADPSAPATGAAAASGGTGFPRTVEHAAGSTVVEQAPRRVVAATDGAELASLLALGVTPVGFGQRNDPLTPWVLEAGGDDPAIERYRLSGEPSFERMASWRPDVIVGQYGFVTEDTIADFAAIAPTVSTSFVGWRENLRQVAATVGEDEEAERLVAELEAEIAAAGERLAGSALRMRWVFAFPGYHGQLNDRSPVGALLTEMGLPGLPAQQAEGEAADEVVAEQLFGALEDADGIVVLDFEEPEGDAVQLLEDQALYATVPAVAAGRVVRLGVADSNAAYFDSVLTVRGNLALVERVVAELQG